MQQTPFTPLGQTTPAFPGEKLPLHSSEEAQNLMGQSAGKIKAAGKFIGSLVRWELFLESDPATVVSHLPVAFLVVFVR
uniref:Uncharacterized protein n=1 Tax=Sphaerodactylus townsendi TaxID=933632 RepID=A0ACB8GEJ7_9SAUR